MRRQLHFRQHVKRPLHQARQIVLADQAMNAGGQILDAHMAIEIRILGVQIRQHVLHPQVEIVGALEVGQAAQQAHRLGFIDADAEQEQQVVRPGLLHHDAALVEVLRHQRRRDPLFLQRPQFIHARRQDRHLDRIEIHMIAIGLAETVPVIVRIQRPALRFIDLFRLPDIEEPAVAFLAQPLHFTAKMQRALHRTVDQAAPRIAAQHGGGGLHRRHDAVVRRSGGVHHVGFVEGALVVVALDMNHRGLREGRQQLVGGLGFVENLTGHPIAAHAALAVVNRVEVGVRHPGGVEVDRRHLQRLLDVVGVVQQAVIGGIGDHRMHRPGGVRGLLHPGGDAGAGKLALRNAAEDAVGVAQRAQIDRHDIAHHQQVAQRFVAIAVDQHRAARRR